MKIWLMIKNILNLPKTIYFNYKFLHISNAWRLPILVHRKVRITRKSRGKIEIGLQPRKIIYVGFPVLNTAGNEQTIISIEGTLRIKGPAFIAQGAHIDIRKNAVLDIGSKFNSTGKMSIVCFKEIQFKDDCTISWDTLFMDTDSHTIFESNTNKILNKNNKIVIGKHCWIGAQSVILKGVHLSDNIVVACNSTVVKSHEADNEIIGGTPVRTLKRNISWCLKEPK